MKEQERKDRARSSSSSVVRAGAGAAAGAATARDVQGPRTTAHIPNTLASKLPPHTGEQKSLRLPTGGCGSGIKPETHRIVQVGKDL